MTSIASHETFRSFWHGSPLGLYQLLCLRTFVRPGHRVEVFSYDQNLSVPDWVARRDANEILASDRVLRYQSGFGRGSPSLHSNLFRYAMLHRLGGWWIDLDVLLLSPDLPIGKFYFAQAAEGAATLNGCVMKFPAYHPLLAEAEERCIVAGENVPRWGDTGPLLLTDLVRKYHLTQLSQPWRTTQPVPWTEVVGLFDPKRSEEISGRCSGAWFLHLFNEIWRGSGIPNNLGPPVGSFLDRLFTEYDLDGLFHERMNFDNVERWITNRRDKIQLEEQNREMVFSASWQLTQPLRTINSILRRWLARR